MNMATWTIANLERNTADGGIVVAHWRCTAEDGDFTVTAYGTAGFTPDASASDFVPYDQLTEADVSKSTTDCNRSALVINLARGKVNYGKR
jgi:hypothetical protein